MQFYVCLFWNFFGSYIIRFIVLNSIFAFQWFCLLIDCPLISHGWEHLSLNSGKRTFLRRKKNIKFISFTSRQSIHSSSKHVESEINPLWYGSAISCIYRLCQFQKSSHNILCCWNMTCVVGELRDLHIIDGLVKNCSNYIAYMVELPQS